MLKAKAERCYSNELYMLQFVTDTFLHLSHHLMTLKYFAINGQGNEQLFFQYMELGDLDAWAEKSLSYSHHSCYRILYHTICGLTELQERQIVHRDIKPKNIFLTEGEDGEIDAKVGDFGFALFIDDLEGQFVVGAWPYVAPELLINYDSGYPVSPEKNSTYASEMYSFGISVYEATVRHAVYPRFVDYKALRKAIITDRELPTHDITSSHPPVSVKLISIFKQCTQFDPALRPTAATVKREFELGPINRSDQLKRFGP